MLLFWNQSERMAGWWIEDQHASKTNSEQHGGGGEGERGSSSVSCQPCLPASICFISFCTLAIHHPSGLCRRVGFFISLSPPIHPFLFIRILLPNSHKNSKPKSVTPSVLRTCATITFNLSGLSRFVFLPLQAPPKNCLLPSIHPCIA